LVNRHRTFEHKSHKPVKKLNTSIELLALSPIALKILGCLGADGVASEAARIAGCTKANVSYWTKRFLQSGALRLQCGGFVKYYSLTPYGSKVLTGSEGRFPVVLEDCAVKFWVLGREKCFLDWRKLGSPRNWVKLGVRIGEVRVVLNQGLSSSVVIHPGQLKGFNVDVLEMDAARVVERVRFVLEGKFGMRLSDEGIPLHGPRWRVYRPECREWVEAGTCEVEGVGGLDHSPTGEKQDPLSRRPHLEFNSKRHAAVAASFSVAYDPAKRRSMAAVNFPVTLENIESKIDFLTETVCRLVDVVGRLSDALGKVFNLEGQEANSTVSGKGVQDYVS